MALFAYLQQVQRLLRDTRQIAFDPQDLIDFINLARFQVAGDSQCLRDYSTVATVNGTQRYLFSGVTVLSSGYGGVLNVRTIAVRVTGGRSALNNWPWPYFNQYYMDQAGAANAQPTQWAQFGQGINGSIYLFPTPNGVYNIDLDTVCWPNSLTTDTTAEAIPYPWTSTIAYFAAYLALLSPTGKSSEQAERMLTLYDKFKERARKMSTPDTLPYQFEQSGVKVPVAPAGVPLSGGNS